MDLKGKVALVTGGARGIGRGIALSLARQGAHVAVADLYQSSAGTAGYDLSTQKEVETVVDEIRVLGCRALGVPVDVTRWQLVEAMVDTVTRELGSVDILCNNAGVIDSGLVVDTTESQWDAMMDVNVKGVFLCSKAAIPGMVRRGLGRIVNISSGAGKRGEPRLAAYCASKFAVLGFTQSVALEVAPHGITVNAICPGKLMTSMWLDHIMDAHTDTEGEARMAAFNEYASRPEHTPLGRPQTPEDIGDAVVYLASADNVTGVALNVSGGSTMI